MTGVGAGMRSNSAFAPRSRFRFSTGSILQALRLPAICLCWYLSSAVTNNIGKQIMNQFRYPITLTFVQFWFVSVFCFLAGAVFNTTKIRRPTRAILEMTAPLVGFQVVGHVFSSVAISRVPLSVVHTVKVQHLFRQSRPDLRATLVTTSEDVSNTGLFLYWFLVF
jgi:hypothetical protein